MPDPISQATTGHGGDGSARRAILARKDTPGLIARPPIVYLCSILSGLILQWLFPVEVFPTPVEAAGGVLISVAAVLFALSVREFQRAGTPIPSSRPSIALVKAGPNRFSRNPIYVSFTLLQIGVAIWVDSVWVLGTLLPTLILIRYGVIAREERYLARKFGGVYLHYKESVRRWL